MELIIKPTGRCNFNCKFCSASCLDVQHPVDNKVPEKLKEFIKKLNPNGFIITGGEPLMVDPDYYYDLHETLDREISITSNLKDFYFHPEKWTPLFKEPWFHIATSFNYGDTRRWDKNTVYDEEMFMKVLDRYREYVEPINPMFLAVIDESNEDKAMDHVYLAKKLNTQVKLNNAIGVGSQSKTYPRYKMYQLYLDIIDAGLDKYESNCSDRKINRCPRNIEMSCLYSIRCVYIDTNGELHVGVCDEQVSWGNFLPEDKIFVDKNNKNFNVEVPIDEFITPECAYCELFRLCNGCFTNRQEAKKDPNYCKEMKKLESRLIETEWLL